MLLAHRQGSFTRRNAFKLQRLTSPNRTIASDASGYAATFTNGARTVVMRGPSRSFTQVDLPIIDNFNRTRANIGWAAANFGGSWGHVGGIDPGNYSVNGSEGIMTVDTLSASRRSIIGAAPIATPDVTYSVKSDKPAMGDTQFASALLCYQDSNNSYHAKLEFLPGIIADDFTRSTTSTWSSTASGYSWSSSGGSTTDFSTTGTTGQHSLGSVNVSRRSVIGSATNADVRMRVRTNALASGSSITAGIMLRYVDSSNYYLARVRFSTTQAVSALIQKNVAGTLVDITADTTVSGLSHTAGGWVNVRAQVSGSTVQMKIWPDNTAEPAGWTVTVTDTTFSSTGRAGVRSILLTGNTNTLPVAVEYDDWNMIGDTTDDTVRLTLQKEVASVFTTLGSSYTYPSTTLTHVANVAIKFRAQILADGTFRARAWPSAGAEPNTWDVSAVDTTYQAGKVGMRTYLSSSTTNAPVAFAFSNFQTNGTIPNPPTVTHDMWVRLLPTPFTGTVNEQWLTAKLGDTSLDILDTAMQYLPSKPTILDAQGRQIAGDASYGPLLSDGKREEGSDFNDYIGITRQYGTYTDVPEANQLRCLDCSGYVRMVYGYRGGIGMTSSVTNGVDIPRVSSVIMASGPGVQIVGSNGTQVTDFGLLQIGDLVGFDADTTNPDEVEGQVDHIGIYLGLDTNGKHRFVSSRKSNDGPSMSDAGGPSILEGTGLYARSFRNIRRF